MPLALALLPGTADAQRPYVREVHDMTGLSVTVKQVRCQADGQPQTWADVSRVRQGGLYRIGRVAYNDGARAVLDHGQAFPVTRRAYERYVLGGEAFNEWGRTPCWACGGRWGCAFAWAAPSTAAGWTEPRGASGHWGRAA
ncbi:hypothetical protein [Deinococcus aestuarii]|uniref:hypothetical protein n=1 Tax=Deinococcus aestuarii TaxID=2774531 RepID=UPI001C0D03F7|nr:hypothetical protein [Deinococcus aestuarii]